MVIKVTSLRRGCLNCGQRKMCAPYKDLREELSRKKKEVKSPQIRGDLGMCKNERRLEGREVEIAEVFQALERNSHYLTTTTSYHYYYYIWCISAVISQSNYWLNEKLHLHKRELALVNFLKH